MNVYAFLKCVAVMKKKENLMKNEKPTKRGLPGKFEAELREVLTEVTGRYAKMNKHTLTPWRMWQIAYEVFGEVMLRAINGNLEKD
jgi:hypothetical protein